MPPRAAQTPANKTKLPAHKLAVSYQRVSTAAQTNETKSGLARQQRARDSWLAANPEYKLHETKSVAISGRKRGRFDWFINGNYPPGTVLLVEDIDRFSRMEVESGIRELLAIFDAGLAIAVCPYENNEHSQWGVLGIITSLNKGGRQIIDALDMARRESDRKRERTLGAIDDKWAAIRAGNLSAAFKPRGKSKSARDYPFWVDFHPEDNDGRGAFRFNEHKALIDRIWQLAREMGGARIAQVLREEGFSSPHPRGGKRKLLSDGVVRNILTRRTAVGEFQPRHKNNQPAGDPIPGVFPPVITESEWVEIRGIIRERDTGLGATRTKRKSNLFEKRCFCGMCGGLVGVQPQTPKKLADGTLRSYPGVFRCRHGAKNPEECNIDGKQVGTRYEEEALLQQLHDFRWEDRYSSTAHDTEIKQARERVLALESTRADKERQVDKIKQGIKAALKEGQAPDPVFAETRQEAEAELIEAENAVAIAQNRLHALQSKTVGKAAAREARARVKAFMATGRHQLKEREEFNEWFHSTGLVVLVNPRTKQTHIGVGSIEDTRLAGFNPAEGMLSALANSTWVDEDGKVQTINPLFEDFKARLEEFKKTGVMEYPEWFGPMYQALKEILGDDPEFQEIFNNPSTLPRFDPPQRRADQPAIAYERINGEWVRS